jgi:hypothetical protein
MKGTKLRDLQKPCLVVTGNWGNTTTGGGKLALLNDNFSLSYRSSRQWLSGYDLKNKEQGTNNPIYTDNIRNKRSYLHIIKIYLADCCCKACIWQVIAASNTSWCNVVAMHRVDPSCPLISLTF